jgi:anti-sigma B factor antagonist
MQQSTREFNDQLLSVSSTRYGDEFTIVSLAGELDLAVLPTAATAIKDAFAAGADRLVLDLQKLEFIDSSGLAMLHAMAVGDVSGGDVIVIPSESPGVSRVLAVTGIDSLLRFVTEPPAVSAV